MKEMIGEPDVALPHGIVLTEEVKHCTYPTLSWATVER